MAKIEKELKMRFISFEEQFTTYELTSLHLSALNKIADSLYLASFSYAFISRNAYGIVSTFDEISTSGNIELFDDTWDLARFRSGEDTKLGIASHNVGMFLFKGSPLISLVFHRSVAWSASTIELKLRSVIVDLLKLRGFDAFIEGNDLKFNLDGYKKKFSSFKIMAIGEYFIINGYLNLTVDTGIMDIVVKKEIVKDGKYDGIPYNTTVGGLFEVKEFDVDIFLREVEQKMSEYLRLELIEDNFSAEEIIEIKQGAEKYKDMDWIMNGISKEDAPDRNSIKEAKIALGIEEIDLGKPPAMQYDEDIDKFPEFKAKLEAKRNVDPILTPKKKEVKNNGSKIRRWY